MSVRQDLSKQTITGLIWAAGEAGARTLLNVGAMVLLAHLLTPSEYGVFGIGTGLVGISLFLTELGFGSSLVQRGRLEARHLDAAFWFSCAFSSGAALVVVAAAGPLAGFFQMPLLANTLRCLSVVFPITGLSVVSESILERSLHFKQLAHIEVISYGIGFVCVAVPLAFLKAGLWSLVAGQITQYLVRAALMVFAARWVPRFSFDRTSITELWGFGRGQTLAQVANYVASNGDNFVVGKLLGAGAMGLYTRAYMFMFMPAYLVGSVLEKVLFPVLSRVKDEPELLRRAYREGNHLLATLILPTSVLIFVLCPDGIPFLLGESWRGVVVPLRLFSLGLLWRTGMKLSNAVVRAAGLANHFAICQVCYAITTIGLASLGSRWGLSGVCVGVLASIFLCYSFSAVLCAVVTKITFGEYVRDHLPGVLLAAGLGPTARLFIFAGNKLNFPVFVNLALTGAAVGTIGAVLINFFPRFFLGTRGARLHRKVLQGVLDRLSRPPLPAAAIPRTYRLETLDAFRGMAAFGVLIYHYCLRYWEATGPNPNAQAEGHGIYLQVVFPWFFFVISGFVIFMTLSRTRNALGFVVSRFSRLYPVYWASLILTFTVMWALPLQSRNFPLQVAIVNLTMLQAWVHQPNVDGVYWTLAIELSFYFLMFWLFQLKLLRHIEWLGLGWLTVECAVAVGQRWLHVEIPSIILNSCLIGYFQLFFAGILFYRIRTEGLSGFRVFLVSLCVLTQGVVYNSLPALLEALAFVILFSLFSGDRLRFLCNRPLLYLGAISYSLYLIHQNIGFTTIFHLSLLGVPQWLCVIVATILSLAAASLLTFLVERPALRTIRRWYDQGERRRSNLAGVETFPSSAK